VGGEEKERMEIEMKGIGNMRGQFASIVRKTTNLNDHLDDLTIAPLPLPPPSEEQADKFLAQVSEIGLSAFNRANAF